MNGTVGVIERYKEFLPVNADTPIITMGEGSTPLVKSTNIGPSVGCENLYFKLEGSNPTGSFKDRGMVMAIAKALEAGRKRVICASTGNTSASAAAYSARYNLKSFVVVPSGEIALGKLAQAMAYGARILAVDGNFDDALSMVRDLATELSIELVNSLNPYRLEGQKTASFEISDALGDSPDMICIPVGNAGNITAYWKGFTEYRINERITKLPRMMGFQAAGAAPIVRGEKVDEPQTIASAIRIGNPASWQRAVNARDESGGNIDAVTDAEIIEGLHPVGPRRRHFLRTRICGVRRWSHQTCFPRRRPQESDRGLYFDWDGVERPHDCREPCVGRTRVRRNRRRPSRRPVIQGRRVAASQ